MPILVPPVRVAESSAPSPSAASLRWSTSADWICAIAVFALWLMTRPYRGVRHDAILYAGQVLARLMPDRVGQDLFFVYGSQDKYSVFSALMAPLFERFGVGASEMVVLALSNALFALACWQLMRPWFSRPLCWVSLMFVVALPHTYGGLGSVSYAETFLTARSIAEPVALFALAQLLRGRPYVAIGLALLAAIFHPLIILPVLVIGWFELVARRREWLWLGSLFLVPVLLGGLGMRPFDAIFHRFDNAWYDAIREPNALVFAKAYGILDWSALGYDVLVLLLCLRSAISGPEFARVVKATLAASALFTALWVLGADVLHDVLLTQLQLWRVYWVMHLLAITGLPLVGIHYWRRGWIGRWCLAALGLAGVAVLSNWPTGWVCLAWAVLAVAAARADAKVSASVAILAAVGSLVALIAISAKVTRVTLLATDLFPDRFAHVGPVMVILGLPAVASLTSLAVVWLAMHGRREAVFASLIVLAGLAFGAYVWDQRSPWQRRLEAGSEAGPPAFDAAIPAHATVYWNDDLATPWLLARRGNFYSFYQGAGLLFSRDTALEFARRSRVMAPIDVQRELCATLSVLTAGAASAGSTCGFTREAVTDVCHGTPHPDYLVFDSRVASAPAVAEWHETPAAAGGGEHAFYLYSCASLR